MNSVAVVKHYETILDLLDRYNLIAQREGGPLAVRVYQLFHLRRRSLE